MTVPVLDSADSSNTRSVGGGGDGDVRRATAAASIPISISGIIPKTPKTNGSGSLVLPPVNNRYVSCLVSCHF